MQISVYVVTTKNGSPLAAVFSKPGRKARLFLIAEIVGSGYANFTLATESGGE